LLRGFLVRLAMLVTIVVTSMNLRTRLFGDSAPTLLENFGHRAVHVLDIQLSQVDDLAIWVYAAHTDCF
jgi:hypothetical protein